MDLHSLFLHCFFSARPPLTLQTLITPLPLGGACSPPSILPHIACPTHSYLSPLNLIYYFLYCFLILMNRCSLAHHLTRLDPDVRVTLIDSRQVAGGATGRNGGLLWPCLNASLRHVVATQGRQAAAEILGFEAHAAAQTRAFIEQDDSMKVPPVYLLIPILLDLVSLREPSPGNIC